jgi:hypothetical protein
MYSFSRTDVKSSAALKRQMEQLSQGLERIDLDMSHSPTRTQKTPAIERNPNAFTVNSPMSNDAENKRVHKRKLVAKLKQQKTDRQGMSPPKLKSEQNQSPFFIHTATKRQWKSPRDKSPQHRYLVTRELLGRPKPAQDGGEGGRGYVPALGSKAGPGKCGAYRQRGVIKTPYVGENVGFHVRWLRQDLPVQINHCGSVMDIRWTIPLQSLRIGLLFPVCVDGLRNQERLGTSSNAKSKDGPLFRELAYCCVKSLCMEVKRRREELGMRVDIGPIIKGTIGPMRDALNTRQAPVVALVLKTLQHFCRCDPAAGRVLVSVFSAILPSINMHFIRRHNTGDGIDYRQRKPDASIRRTWASAPCGVSEEVRK